MRAPPPKITFCARKCAVTKLSALLFRWCTRAVGSGAAGAAQAAPLFWPLTPFDYERAGGLHQQGTTRTLLRCTGNVELLCLSSKTRSRSIPGLRGRNPSHPFFSARTRSYVSESVDNRHAIAYISRRLIFRPPHPPCPSYGPVYCVVQLVQWESRQFIVLMAWHCNSLRISQI